MRILFSTGSAAHYMAPPRLAEEQINCGPHFEDETVADRVLSLKTPTGEYDLASVLTRLPLQQLPEAVVCLVDASWRNVPRNLKALPCPKVLLVADTHHMDRPLAGMIDYIASEKFDRVVILYDRHHLELLRAAGVPNLHWFPGLTFPHGDAAVRAARQPVREARLALVGQAGQFHARRLRLAGALAAQKLPLELKALPQPEALDFYGSSLIAFNASLNGDLNLRVFEALAAGAMLLTDRLSPEAGLETLWRDGRELVLYDNADELAERARYWLDHPAEARAIGAAGARWFDEHFSEERRRAAFADLALTGRSPPEFCVPAQGKKPLFGGDGRRLRRVLPVYEAVQRIHAGQETSRVVMDAGVPDDFERTFRTLPRVGCARLPAVAATPGKAPDLAIVGRATPLAGGSAAARRIWVWDLIPGEVARVKEQMAAAGLAARGSDSGLFFREGVDSVPAPDPVAANARTSLETGDLSRAFVAAKQAIAERPDSLEGYLVMAELALETGKADLFGKMLGKARSLAAGDPRIALLELPSVRASAKSRQPARLLAMAWLAFDQGLWAQAAQLAQQARTLEPELAEAHHVEGRAGANAARRQGAWMQHGLALRSLLTAANLRPGRADYWRVLAIARGKAGLVEAAVEAYDRVLGLGEGSLDDIFGRGEALLAAGEAAAAGAAFAVALERAPCDIDLRRWHGHALKRQGRIEEAQLSYCRSFGGGPASAPRSRSDRRRVVFVVQNGHSWPCMASVHAAFASDPAWETVLVALPWEHPSFNQSSRHDSELIFDFLAKEKIPYVRWDQFSLLQQAADLVFLQNPYDSTRPDGWKVPDLVKAGHRLCYVPYAIELGGTHEDVLYQFNMPLQQFAWAVMARSEEHRALFAEHCRAGNHHVIATGHPKFDLFGGLDAVPPDAAMLAFGRGRPLVLWTPHFDVRLNGTRFGDGYSTFHYWQKFLMGEFVRRQDLAFVIRPHPCFFAGLEHRGIMSREELDAFERQCAAAGNILIDRSPGYHAALAAADALVSDLSSVIIEYGISGRPVCYLHNPNGPMTHLDYELDFDYIRQHCAWAVKREQISSFLDRVAARRETVSAERALELRRRMGARPDGGVGREVKRSLEERLAAVAPIEVARVAAA